MHSQVDAEPTSFRNWDRCPSRACPVSTAAAAARRCEIAAITIPTSLRGIANARNSQCSARGNIPVEASLCRNRRRTTPLLNPQRCPRPSAERSAANCQRDWLRGWGQRKWSDHAWRLSRRGQRRWRQGDAPSLGGRHDCGPSQGDDHVRQVKDLDRGCMRTDGLWIRVYPNDSIWSDWRHGVVYGGHIPERSSGKRSNGARH